MKTKAADVERCTPCRRMQGIGLITSDQSFNPRLIVIIWPTRAWGGVNRPEALLALHWSSNPAAYELCQQNWIAWPEISGSLSVHLTSGCKIQKTMPCSTAWEKHHELPTHDGSPSRGIAGSRKENLRIVLENWDLFSPVCHNLGSLLIPNSNVQKKITGFAKSCAKITKKWWSP